MSSDNSLPPVNPDAQAAIDQLGKDKEKLNSYKRQRTADYAALKDFLDSIVIIAKKYGPGVALQRLTTEGFSDIDKAKNDDFAVFSGKLNIATDYATIGSKAEGYVNEGGKVADGGGISLKDTYSLYRLLKTLEGAATDPDMDGETGKLIASSAQSLLGDTGKGILFNPSKNNGDLSLEILEAQTHINSIMSGGGDGKMDPAVKQTFDALNQVTTATNTTTQTLQTQASVATSTYKQFEDVQSKLCSNWSSGVGTITKNMANK